MTVPQEIIIQRLSSEPNSKQPLVSTKGPFATNINQIPHRKDKVSSLMLRCGCGSLLRSPGGGGGVFLGIPGGGVLPSSPIPDPSSDQKLALFKPVFRPGLQEILSSLLRLEK